jgi:PII-like signaling protein
MLAAGPAKKVTIYVGEEHKHHGQSLYAAILDFLFYRGISGASVVRGIAGFGADHHLHTDRLEVLSQDLPIKIEFIESAAKVDEVLPKLRQLAGSGLIEIQDTTVVKAAETSAQRDAELAMPALKREGKAKLMRIFIGENDKWHDKPLYKALLESMRTNDIAGATIYQGILGYGANRRIHKDTALHLSHDRPIMISVVETEEKLQTYFPLLDEMVQQGLVVLSDVDVIKYTRDSATATTLDQKEARP